MSKQSTLWAAVVICASALIGSAIVYSPSAQGGPTIPQGGQTGKIRSYFAQASTGSYATIIPSAEGMNGFLITDIHQNTPSGSYELEFNEGSGFILLFRSTQPGVSFKSGLPIPAGAEVRIKNGASGTLFYTIVGHTY